MLAVRLGQRAFEVVAGEIGNQGRQLQPVAQRPAEQIARFVLNRPEQLFADVVCGDRRAGRPQYQPVDGRLEFPHVPGPGVPQQKVPGRGRKGLLLDAGLVGELAVRGSEEVVDERRQVTVALAQRREPNDAGRESIVEIFAEPAGRYLGPQVAVRGRR